METQQLINELRQKGGFSFDLKKQQFTDQKGYFVSVYGREKTSETITEKHIIEYINNNLDNLASGRYLLGCWFNPKTNLFYLDCSVCFCGLFDAIKFGMLNNQLSIYDGHKGTTITLKSKQRTGTVTQQIDYINSTAKAQAEEYLR